MAAVLKGIASGERYQDYARRADGPMLVLALVFLVLWTLTSVATGLPEAHGRGMAVANGIIWVAFAVDLVVRIVLARSSWGFVRRHPLDVLAVVVPMLRPLKVLAVFTQGQFAKPGGARRTSQAVLVSALLLLWIGAVAVFNAEHDAPDSEIVTFGDAVWWALVTVTTVGYGDLAPVTPSGRVVAGGLMVVGIALLGVITASVAAWFVNMTSGDEARDDAREVEEAREHASLQDLSRRLATLEAKIDRLVEQRGRGEPPGR